jgi:phosphoesterase RecJ-like protein
MTETLLLNKIIEKIQKAERIGLMAHKRVDGDSAGAVFALYSALKMTGKSPIIFSETKDEFLPFFDDLIEQPNFYGNFLPIDLLILLDLPLISMSAVEKVALEAKKNNVPIILIDHHDSGDSKDFADIALIDKNSVATCETLFDLILNLGVNIDKSIATFLYTGIATDSGSFQYQKTTEKTLQIGSELIKFGAKKDKVIEESFLKHSIEKLKLWGIVMERLFFNPTYDAAITYFTYKDVKNCNLNKASASQFANYINSIKDTKVVAVLYEEIPGKVKVSLRSNDKYADVSKVAALFGGGGHIKASAFTVDGTIVETTEGIKVV